MRVRAAVGLITILIFSATLPLCGQETRGALLGRVTDPTGAVVVGAKVDVTNTATGVHATTTTNGSGDYILPFLIPGPYSITATMPGFKTYTRSGIDVRVSDRITIDVAMELGQAAESVNVSGEAPLVDTSTASVGRVVDSRTGRDVPPLVQGGRAQFQFPSADAQTGITGEAMGPARATRIKNEIHCQYIRYANS